MIKLKVYNINKIILTNEVLSNHILKFWNEVFSTLNQNGKVNHLMILCKIRYSENGSYKTLGPLRRVEFKDLELFKNYLIERLGIFTDSYEPASISEIVFTYVIKDGPITEKDRLLLEDLTENDKSFHEFNKMKLPVSMNPKDYGTIRGKSLLGDFIRYFVRSINTNRVYEIDVSVDQLVNKVSIIGASDLTWVDTRIDENLFKREIGKVTFYFLDGEMVLVKRMLPAKPFSRLRSNKNIN